MKRGMMFFILFLLLSTSFTQARGLPAFEAGTFDFKKIQKNGQEVFEYTAPSPIINQDLDRIRTLFTKITESLNGILLWDDDENTIQLVKPNVQMMIVQELGFDANGVFTMKNPFGRVKKGEPLERFFVRVELESLPEEELEFRLIVEAPKQEKINEKEFVVSPGSATNKEKDKILKSQYINFEVSNPNFNQVGTYKLKLQMKWVESEKAGDSFYTIAEKSLRVE